MFPVGARTMPCTAMHCCANPAMAPFRVMTYPAMPCRVVPYRAVSCHASPCHMLPCCAAPSHSNPPPPHPPRSLQGCVPRDLVRGCHAMRPVRNPGAYTLVSLAGLHYSAAFAIRAKIILVYM